MTILSVVDPAKPDLVDLRDVKIVKKLRGTVDDTELVKDLVEEVSLGDGKIVKITGIKDMGRTTIVLVRGLNQLVLDEAERSLHDALCVVRCLVNKRFLIAGGGAPEIELSRQLGAWVKVFQGMESYCVRSFAEALEVIPYTLAENAGLNPIAGVSGERNTDSYMHILSYIQMERRGGVVDGGGRREGVVTSAVAVVVDPVSGIDAVGGWVCGFGGS
ncbi:hypothetical protein F0562_033626 [Nyssa sinensis]|uniref:T-complex protein 1 subunit delta n=1 Tax=Nyssa sinensis TaxID=561372 RepID=A0A5J5AEU5_9ASTE|nr:hypothetical protein F0562_033626 [Nyssa sinensis]